MELTEEGADFIPFLLQPGYYFMWVLVRHMLVCAVGVGSLIITYNKGYITEVPAPERYFTTADLDM